MVTKNKGRKSKEMHAEQLLKVSTSLLTAFFITILIVPISIIVGAAFNNTPNVSPYKVLMNLFGSWYAIIFLLAEASLYYVVFKTRTHAFSIYDELYPDEKTETE